DKNMPGSLIAIARLNRPAVFIYGGTILPGCLTISEASPDGPRPIMPKTLLDIVSVFEAVGKHAAGKIDDRTLQAIEQCAIPGPGSCGGMYPDNTMAPRIGKRVPVLADLKPSGKHVMSELVAIGGIRPLMKTLLDAGLLHGDALTVTGQTMAETLADVQPYPAGQTIIQPLDQPIKKDS